jgi:hypothetical protein
VNLGLGDDTFATVFLGWNFPYYEVPCGNVNVCSNGRLTFNVGSTDFTESKAEFRSQAPNICAFWDDLNPGAAGAVLACNDPAACTLTVAFQAVPEFPNFCSNTATFLLDATGTIRLSYGACTLIDSIAGISPGNNIDLVLRERIGRSERLRRIRLFQRLQPDDLPGFQRIPAFRPRRPPAHLPPAVPPANIYFVF